MRRTLDERVLRSKGGSLICAVSLGRIKSGLNVEDVDAIMPRLRCSCLRERVTGFVTSAGSNLVVYLEGNRRGVAGGFREIEGNPGLSDVWLLAYAGLSKRQFADIELGVFEGDTGGTQTLESSFLGCRRGDLALLDETLRIHSAAYSPTDSTKYPTRQVGAPVLTATDLTRTVD